MKVENHLRVSSFNYAPYHVTAKLGHNVPVQGVCGEILTAIARSMRMNYSIAFPTDSFWGLRKPDGNWTGIIGMLQRDEADLALSVINPTSEKKDVAVATESIVPIELVIMAGRLSRHESDIFGLIQIFSWQVWTCFVCAMILSAITWALSDIVHSRKQPGHNLSFLSTFFDHLWLFIGNTCVEASPSTPNRDSARIVVGSFWLVVIILTTGFAGMMKAMMMVKNEADRIDSIRDLSLRPWMKPYLPAGGAAVSSIRDSRDTYYQKVWRMAQKHKGSQPPAVVLSETSLREVVVGKSVLILSRAAAAARATIACSNSTVGEYYVGEEPTFYFNSVFYLNKRMPLERQQAINSRILWLRDSGLVEKWWKDSSGHWKGCGQTISDGNISFSDFKELLLFWMVMLAASTCVFAVEVLSNLSYRIRPAICNRDVAFTNAQAD
ncbi:glutamate receptor-like [Ixodes scapularis]|uniref:glutamate receptor-like n=1 Tax=Ixodes scapularis TaxID=6945 RepID=UPI001A9E93FB|nr:glutamate receptor-like [Ixodes scapularis]